MEKNVLSCEETLVWPTSGLSVTQPDPVSIIASLLYLLFIF